MDWKRGALIAAAWLGTSEPAGHAAPLGKAFLSAFRVEATKAINGYRQRHGCPAVQSDGKLDQLAQAYAEQLAKANKGLKHSSSSYGETLSWSFSTAGDPEPAALAASTVKGWYDEIKAYRFNKPGFSPKTGHFTQVVWKDTERVGCGAARASDGAVFVVCNYDPRGNFATTGQEPKAYSQNVPRPRR